MIFILNFDGDLNAKILAATWNWNDSTWLAAAKSTKST